MNIYLKTLVKYWKTVVACGLLGCLLTLALSFVRPVEYTSTTTLLIIQQSGGTLDPATAFKSIESLGDNLSQIIYTSDFFNKVMQTDPTIDQKIFPANEVRKRDKWRKMVETSLARGTGFLQVAVYHPTPAEARKIVQAISVVLMSEGWTYVSAPIEIKLVDAAVESRFPTRPNLPVNAFIGLVLGVGVGCVYVLHERRLLRRAVHALEY